MKDTDVDVERAHRLREFIAEFREFLSNTDVFYLSEFVDVGEFDLAFETLCTQLYEYEISLSDETVDRLAAIGTGLELDPRLWEDLRG